VVLFLDAMNTAPLAPPPTDPLWNEAYERVESYLRAHRIAHPLALHRITAAIVARAWEAAPLHPRENPVVLAMREADTAITDWFARVLEQAGPHSRRLGVRGRLALALADVPGRWPASFLATFSPPGDLSAAMREAFLHSGPLPRPVKMTPRRLDLGTLAAVFAGLWFALERSATLRLLRRAGVIAGSLVLLWFAFRR
jgi:hypothetical protein